MCHHPYFFLWCSNSHHYCRLHEPAQALALPSISWIVRPRCWGNFSPWTRIPSQLELEGALVLDFIWGLWFPRPAFVAMLSACSQIEGYISFFTGGLTRPVHFIALVGCYAMDRSSGFVLSFKTALTLRFSIPSPWTMGFLLFHFDSRQVVVLSLFTNSPSNCSPTSYHINVSPGWVQVVSIQKAADIHRNGLLRR